MDNQTICAYLWQEVIRLGFSPSSTSDKKRWLRQYGQSLKDFWEIDLYPKIPRESNNCIVADFSCVALKLCFEYAVESNDKFTVRFMHEHIGAMWVHDVDGKYFTFPIQLFLNSHGKRSAVISKFSNSDIEAVVDGLLIHPTAHIHLECPIDNHEIRIGGGINNPFQYLFHLRYQLCPIEAKRTAEKKRLIELFCQAIRREDDKISAAELMEQPKL